MALRVMQIFIPESSGDLPEVLLEASWPLQVLRRLELGTILEKMPPGAWNLGHRVV
jgi:hypothetical protein